MRHTTLYVFNPEHDLCLANGDKNFVPPASAMEFAERGKGVMGIVHGADIDVVTADGFAQWRQANMDCVLDAIEAWGWDSRLKECLVRQGAPTALLPDDDYLAFVRTLQHRTTALPLQPHACRCCSLDEVKAAVARNGRSVCKAPWSGAGRGLRWVDGAMNRNDELWVEKIIKTQGCVTVEQRKSVKYNFALELSALNGHVELVGYSLFSTKSGVYRRNVLLPDDEIKALVGFGDSDERLLLSWVQKEIAQAYRGFLGIDMIRTEEDETCVCELNLRYTMGLVAHCYLMNNPDKKGMEWHP